jgi:hypothetical protein
MATKRLKKTLKEVKTSGMNDGMSTHANIPELRNSDWSTQSRDELREHGTA